MGTDRLPLARFEPPALRTIVRERVDRRLERAWDVPLTVIVGPAGAGKTTAASHLVQGSARPSLWYRAHAGDGDEATLCGHLAQAWEHTTSARCRWTSIAEVVVDIERSGRADGLLLVLDEFDAVIGTPSEEAVGDALTDIAPSIHLVTLSRHRPSFNLSRMRVAGAVCEIGPDDLRFRSWEVDRLFRELYDRPLLPDEVSELERRTGGWVAALHLFNVAVAGLAPLERRAVLAQVGRRAGPDWDFLADNVLAGLRDDLKLFLLETAPLPRLTASLCDDLLATNGSWQQIQELERLQLVTPSVDSPGSYRSHEVLRSHLDGLLVEWEGADAVHKRYRQAAEALEAHGHVTEALSAYCRGEDWASAGRLLGSRGAEVAARPGAWLGGLPATFLDTDPWLLLAIARQQRSDGRLSDAIATYQRVERAALSSVPMMIARRERLLLASLLDRSSPPSLAWVGALRDAAFGELATVIVDARSPHDDLARGVVKLLAGDVRAAGRLLRAARDAPDASPALALAAGLGHVVVTYLSGTVGGGDLDELERAAALVEVPFLTRLCRAAAATVTDDAAMVAAVVEDCDRAGDDVGAAVAATLGSLAAAWRGSPDLAGGAAERCRAAGLRNLETWALATAAVGAPGVDDAEPASRRRWPPALQLLASVVGASGDPGRAAEAERLAARLHSEHGIAVPAAEDGATPPAPSLAGRDTQLELNCLGRFAAARGGVPLDVSTLRPRARAVLRMLAVGVGEGVHRQVIYAELWPDDTEPDAARKLHVAVSSIRKLIEPVGLVHRDGEVYRLDGDVRCDVRSFEQALASARTALAGGAADRAATALDTALGQYAGPLLPEDSSSEWVETRRRRLQALAAEAARQLAELRLADGDAPRAIEVCRAGLAIDRFADPLWRLLLRALDADGDPAGHARASTEYDAVLAELGITS